MHVLPRREIKRDDRGSSSGRSYVEFSAKRVAEIIKSLTYESHSEKDISDWATTPEARAA